MIKTYFSLTKPGIIFGNAITAAAGFFLASKGVINFRLFLVMLAGLSFVIGSSCVFNNYIDRSIDEKMDRTKNRVLVKRRVPIRNALIFGSILGLLGFFILALYTNLLTVILAAIGFFFYVIMYSYWKRRSIHGTVIGSISGAVPPVVGYCAVTNNFDTGALLIFIILVLWQMPHFYAIAIYRLNDYTAASIPVLPVKKGIYSTKMHMLFYIVAFTLAALMLTFFKFTGYTYFVVVSFLGLAWIVFALKGFKTSDNRLWARKMFIFSLVIIIVFCIMTSINAT